MTPLCRCLAALAPTHKARALQAAGDAVIPSLAGAGAGGAPTSPSFQHQLHHSSSGNLLSAAGTGPQGGTGMSRSQSVGVLPGSSTGAAARGSGPGGAGGAAGPEGGFLGILRGLTLALISAGGVTSGGSSCAGGVDEGDDLFWLRECVDMLLEVRCMVMVVSARLKWTCTSVCIICGPPLAPAPDHETSWPIHFIHLLRQPTTWVLTSTPATQPPLPPCRPGARCCRRRA